LLDLSSSLLTGVAETPDEPAGDYALVLGAGLTDLKTTHFTAGVNASPPEGYSNYQANRLLFEVITGLPDGTQWAELRRGGTVLAHLDKTTHAPQVELLSPNGGEHFAPDAVMSITWTSSDQDGGTLLHTIEYSPDSGGNWIVVASQVGGNAYSLNLGEMPGTSAPGGLVRVTVSDGFNQGQAQSQATFQVGGKPPQVSITSLSEGQNVLQCGLLPLQGVAYDPEGGDLTYQWRVDGQAAGETAQAWAGPLAPGEHQVAFRAEDPTALASQTQVHIAVLADTDCDGMSDAFEEKYHLNPLSGEDASLDNDQDGLTNLQEYGFGTDPTNPDTDGDGYLDGTEIAQGTNPLVPPNLPPVKLFLPVIFSP
jgi:Bacterial TSP3 repeat